MQHYSVVYVKRYTQVDSGYGDNTGAYGYASAVAAWDGFTGEAFSFGSITNGTGKDVGYSIVINYQVAELQKNNNDQLRQFDLPDIAPLNEGTITKNSAEQKKHEQYLDSFTIVWIDEGDRFIVQTECSVEAYNPHIEQTDANTDRWYASDSDELNFDEVN